MANAEQEPNEGLKSATSIVYYLRALWAGKFLIVAGTILCIAVALAMSSRSPEYYEANATLVLLPPPFKFSPDIQTLTVQDYQIFLHSDGVLIRVVDKLREKGMWSEDELADFAKPSRLSSSMSVVTRVVEKTARGTNYSPVILLKARASTAQKALDIAKAWAEVAVEAAADIYKGEKSDLSGFAKQQFRSTKEALDRIYGQQREIEAAWDEQIAWQRLTDKAALLAELENDRVQTLVEIKVLRKQVEELNARLQDENQILTVWKSPPMTAVFLEQQVDSDKARAKSTDDDRSKGYREEQLNPTYLYVKQELMNGEKQLKGLEERERALVASVESVSKELEHLREENAHYNYEKKRLQHDAMALARSYSVLTDKLEEAEMAESEQENLADIKLLADAVLPDTKVTAPRRRIVAVAGLVGLGLSCFGAVFRYRLTGMV